MKPSNELSCRAYVALYKAFGDVLFYKMFDIVKNDTDLLSRIVGAVFDVLYDNREDILDCFADTYLTYIKESLENEKKNKTK